MDFTSLSRLHPTSTEPLMVSPLSASGNLSSSWAASLTQRRLHLTSSDLPKYLYLAPLLDATSLYLLRCSLHFIYSAYEPPSRVDHRKSSRSLTPLPSRYLYLPSSHLTSPDLHLTFSKSPPFAVLSPSCRRLHPSSLVVHHVFACSQVCTSNY